ncbi:LytR/AlgR family response regulator transcription factor [Cyclobacterium plantarum]|uniref:Response regulator n=1 Tax=Cyclobacterium plantarum TaxID=2716263 RepID=A0ABX0HF40_9BACT|nr:response regulator [Cyclobacterium plantarum]NHE58991.1 response regulator [Cyclobacterium plantarum]
MKILIVEDDPFIGEEIALSINEHFSDDPHEIHGPAATYQAALDIILNEQPEVALLDISLGEDVDAGIRLAQYLNRSYPIPIVFLSGLPRSLGFNLAKYLMPFDFIPKPVDYPRLMDKIELATIFQSQRSKLESMEPNQNGIQNKSIFVATSHNEATAIPIKELILLEADDKLIRAYTINHITPIPFTSPGLKNFYRDNLYLLRDFHHINRKYVINLPMVTQIKDNHVILPREVRKGELPFFRIPIPRNGDAKKLLYARLGFKLKPE